MRKLRHLSMALVLTLMLGTSVLAGIIDCPPVSPPPPEQQSSNALAGIVLALVQIAVP